MSFKTFAVAGGLGGETQFSAALGPEIVKALVANGGQVKVLARDGVLCVVMASGGADAGAGSAKKSSATALEALGASIVTVDYDKPETLVSALDGVEVLVSAFGSGAIASQQPLVGAAAKAGVALFVPRLDDSLDRHSA
jgi:uncharacterized protein YbjT (DUF2867 family)